MKYGRISQLFSKMFSVLSGDMYLKNPQRPWIRTNTDFSNPFISPCVASMLHYNDASMNFLKGGTY
jgi:hypothetical protein